MNRSILGRAAFSAAVALAMGFGAREALAAPETKAARPYCRDDLHCEEICVNMYGPNAAGVCSSGHSCFCYY